MRNLKGFRPPSTRLFCRLWAPPTLVVLRRMCFSSGLSEPLPLCSPCCTQNLLCTFNFFYLEDFQENFTSILKLKIRKYIYAKSCATPHHSVCYDWCSQIEVSLKFQPFQHSVDAWIEHKKVGWELMILAADWMPDAAKMMLVH